MAVPTRVSARRRRLRRWARRAVGLGLGALLAVTGYAFYGQVTAVLDLRRELDALERQRAELQMDIDQLRARLSLKDDPEYLEYLARKELGLIKPGEVKLILPPDLP